MKNPDIYDFRLTIDDFFFFIRVISEIRGL